MGWRRSGARVPAIGAAAATLLLGCLSGALAEEPVIGSVRDADTGEAIVGAWIFEVFREPGSGADLIRVARARSTRSDAQGGFRFEPSREGQTFGRRYPPIYHFYDPSYGLLRVRATDEGRRVDVRPSLRDAHLRIADAVAFCAAPVRDAMAEKIVALTCPPAKAERFADGSPRATGDVDARGRRNGPWTFYREDGTVIARGEYRTGAAIGAWRFEPPAGEPPARD